MTPAPIELSLDSEKIREMPMVDLAFMILKKVNEPYYYPDLMKEVARQRSLTDEEAANMIAQLYTEINIDGRFACVGTNLWGLKRWYPLEKSEDPVVSAKRPRIINDEDDDDLDEDTTFNADDESFDDANEEEDDLFDNDEDDVDEDVIVDDEIEEDEEIEGEEIDEDLEEDEDEDDEEEDYKGEEEES